MDRRENQLRGLMAKPGFRSVSHLAEILTEKYPDLKVDRAMLSRFLNAKRPRPNIHLMFAVARELGTTMDSLYELVAPESRTGAERADPESTVR